MLRNKKYVKVIPEKPFRRILLNPFFVIFFSLMLICSLMLNIAARHNILFANWYSNYIYPNLVYVIGGTMSVFPFSVAEILLYMLIAVTILKLIYMLVQFIRYLIKKMPSGSCYYLALFIRYILVMSVILLFGFTTTCGINYHRFPFSHYSDLNVTTYDSDVLLEFCEYLIDNVNETATNVYRDDNAVFSLDNTDYTYEAKTALERLGMVYPVLSGFYPDAKPVISSKFMTYSFITGIYAPYTIEANYNNMMPDLNIPFTICHELSHLRGFMREDEANFIAYLACRESSCIEFQYSGYANALSYALSAILPYISSEEYTNLVSEISPLTRLDYSDDSSFWNAYKTPVKAVASSVNDSYLKANNQYDGVLSYGRIVDLMLADYVQNIKTTEGR